ncbi:hypothetical protein AX17_006830 [Amanita inopinata Kibby_2008]|nr:hypothetical protein AX17_006830 [Amanita inopinata Kibby_2008]
MFAFIERIQKRIAGVPVDYSLLPSSRTSPSTSPPHSPSPTHQHRRQHSQLCNVLYNPSSLPLSLPLSLHLRIQKRPARIAVAAGTITVFLSLLLGIAYVLISLFFTDQGPPPFPLRMYEQYRSYERQLPQNNLSLPFPEGEYAKFLHVDNYSTHVGWGNLLQELMMNAFLAYSSKRALVLYEFAWDSSGRNYSKLNDKYIPSSIPVSVTLAGPVAGGSMGGGNKDVPRAVSKEYFDVVCPEKTVINGDKMKKRLEGATAGEIVSAWVKELDSVGDRCIEIEKGTGQIFDYRIFSETHLLDVWPELSRSPLLERFAWSPLVLNAYHANRHLFESVRDPVETEHSEQSSPLDGVLSDPYAQPAGSPEPSEPLKGLLILHIRQGDFKRHCKYLKKHNSIYNAFNSFEELPDRFDPPTASPARDAYYREHCYPSLERIVAKVQDVRQRQNGLDRLYIMSNADKAWLETLADALGQTGSSSPPWASITTSRDLTLTWEQKYVSQALDVLVAQRAQAFIGNGFSSLTSNIVMLRMSSKRAPGSTYFW